LNKTVVFGASGFIGQALIPRIEGEVIALSKSKMMDDSKSVLWFSTDLTKEISQFPKELVYGAETAFHLAEDPHNNLKLSENIISIVESCFIKRLIVISLSGVDVEGTSRFHREKYMMEQLAINSLVPEVIIVRIPILISKNRNAQFDRYLAGYMKLPFIYPILGHKKDCPLLAVEDLSQYLARLGKLDSQDPRCIIDLATSRFTMKKIFLQTMRAASPKVKLGIPYFFGDWLGGLIDFSQRDRLERMKSRDFLRAMIQSSNEKEIPPGFPEPKFYDSFDDVYQ